MAITSGSYTIKTAAGDYSSWTAFWDDIGNLTGNITCTVDASAYTEAAGPAPVAESLNGNTLHVLPAAFPTATDASDGARFTFNTADSPLIMGMEGAGEVIVEGMVFIKGSAATAIGIYLHTVDTAFDFIVRRNIFKGLTHGLYLWDTTMNVAGAKYYNNIFFDIVLYAISTDGAIPNAVIANNTMDNCGSVGIYCFNNDATIENNISYNNTNDFFQVGSATGNNNADSDNTGEDADWNVGANNVPGIGDPFNAIGSDDFTITAEGVIGSAGKDLSGTFTDDFFGVIRSNWTIGACEFAVQDVTEAVSALIEVEAEITSVLDAVWSTSALIEMEASITSLKSRIHEVSALIEVEASITAQLDALSEVSALIEMEAAVTPSARIIVEAVSALIEMGAEVTVSSVLQWLLIDDTLTWKGEWISTYAYELNDVVLYKSTDGNEWHVFMSKITHNVGNIPVSSASAWRRYYQEILL